MAILLQGFETLSNSGYMNGKVIDKRVNEGSMQSIVTLDDLMESARRVHEGWSTEIIDNSQKRNFGLTDDLEFSYLTQDGAKRSEDITQFGFQQLCGRMGIPAQYIEKCCKNGKEDLALQNFKSWADDYKGNLKVMRNNGVTRAVVSENYAPYESYFVLNDLKRSVNLNRWILVQSFLSEDKLVARFVDTKSPIYEDNDSKLYVLFTVRSSDVGKGSLSVNMGIWRQACTNGMIIASGDACLFKAVHSGAKMQDESKLEAFKRAMYRADTFGTKYANGIEKCRKERLSETEFKLWVEKVTRDLKLSKDRREKFEDLVNINYERNVWGIINGVTELAQTVTVDNRMDFETWGGEIFSRFVA